VRRNVLFLASESQEKIAAKIRRHRTERGSAGSRTLSGVITEIDPALPRSVC